MLCNMSSEHTCWTQLKELPGGATSVHASTDGVPTGVAAGTVGEDTGTTPGLGVCVAGVAGGMMTGESSLVGDGDTAG